VLALYDRAAELTDDKEFGLRVVRHVQRQAFDLLSFMDSNSSTIGETLRRPRAAAAVVDGTTPLLFDPLDSWDQWPCSSHGRARTRSTNTNRPLRDGSWPSVRRRCVRSGVRAACNALTPLQLVPYLARFGGSAHRAQLIR
jgi:hypothetical protein